LAIQFINQHPHFLLPESGVLTQWLKNCAQNEKWIISRLSYTFLTDEALHQMNMKFLNHDTFTDIITFDYNVERFIIGEIYISLDRVDENARNLQLPFNQELSRILIHGLLHLMGYADKLPLEKKLMTSKEDYYLSLQPSF
jgi:probable rRNA maturation factor